MGRPDTQSRLGSKYVWVESKYIRKYVGVESKYLSIQIGQRAQPRKERIARTMAVKAADQEGREAWRICGGRSAAVPAGRTAATKTRCFDGHEKRSAGPAHSLGCGDGVAAFLTPRRVAASQSADTVRAVHTTGLQRHVHMQARPGVFRTCRWKQIGVAEVVRNRAVPIVPGKRPQARGYGGARSLTVGK